MKYLIQYPLSMDCNLRCEYCFNREYYLKDLFPQYKFFIEDYITFRDTHLLDKNTEITLRTWGGEPFVPSNIIILEELLNKLTIEKFDILTHGGCNTNQYAKLITRHNINKIERVGFTYHRLAILNYHEIPAKEYNKKFMRNVLLLKEAGVNVYVKEILVHDEIEKTLNHREFWKQYDVPLKIQHYRNCGIQAIDEMGKIKDPKDITLIDDEYRTFNKETKLCQCKRGYRGLIIKQNGDVLACWHDQTSIGNVLTNTFSPRYYVTADVSIVNGIPIKKERVVIK